MRAPEREHQLVHPIAGQGIQRGEGLIEQQQPGLAPQRPGQRHALRLPARERQRPGGQAMAQAHFLERGLAAVADAVNRQ